MRSTSVTPGRVGTVSTVLDATGDTPLVRGVATGGERHLADHYLDQTPLSSGVGLDTGV